MFLGLDLGTSCGWANLLVMPDKGTMVVSGTWDCSVRSGIDSPSLRFETFAKWLDDMLALGPDRVFYELVRAHRGVKAAHIYGGFLAKVQERCDFYCIPFQGIDVGTIKKHTAGKGNASKFDMVEAVKRLGFSPKTEDEADAIGVVLTGWNVLT